MRCSAGTYVRALARDLGERLGSGAYLAALTRTASGPFRLDQARPLDEVRGALAGGRARDILLPPDAGLDDLPRLTLTGRDLRSLLRGQAVPAARLSLEAGDALPELVRVADDAGRLAAIARLRDGRLQPEKVLVPLGND
jgi:tRNA pseudouridine55 synthase